MALTQEESELRKYHTDSDKGSFAIGPLQIPWKGIKEVGKRVFKQIGQDQLMFLSAGVAFYAMLALVPLMVALVSIYGLAFDASDVANQVTRLRGVIPPEALGMIQDQLTRVANNTGAAGFGTVFGILVALWSGSKAFDAIMIGTNFVYQEKDDRGFLEKKGTSLALTLGTVLVVTLTLLFTMIAPVILRQLQLEGASAFFFHVLGWPLVLAVLSLWLAVIYRYGPCRKAAKWRWLNVGAIIAALVFMLASGLFSLYVSNFGSYNESYGALGGIMVMLLWLYMGGFSALLGAEINAELEHQTVRDSTTGPVRSLGNRGAFVADDVVYDESESPDSKE